MELQAQMALFNSSGISDFLKYFFLICICVLWESNNEISTGLSHSALLQRDNKIIISSDDKKEFCVVIHQ